MRLLGHSTSNQNSKQPGKTSLALAVGLFVVSVFTIIYAAVGGNSGIPTPNSSASGEIPSATGQRRAGGEDFLPFSRPTSLRIDSADILSDLTEVGKNSDGAVDVPKGEDYEKAAWYRNSPTPGQIGASVIIGHVDSYERGESVFFRLGSLKLGDEIVINREDGTAVVFEVKAVRQYDRANFPADTVYGSSGEASELRLITCAGQYDPQTGLYDQNTVVFAALKSL